MSEFYIEYLSACVKCIDDNDYQLFHDLINAKIFDIKEVDRQMIDFLYYCRDLGFRDQFVKIIYNTWKYNVEPTLVFKSDTLITSKPSMQVDFMVYIASRLYNDHTILKYIIDIASPGLKFKDIVYPDIINNVNDSTTELICLALDKCFDDVEYDVYRELLNLSLGKNSGVTNYMSRRLIDVSDYAGIPSHVDLNNIRIFEIIELPQYKKLDYKQCLNYLLNHSKQFFDFDDKERNKIIKNIDSNITNVDEFIENTSKIYYQELNNLENLDLYFKMYGFSNPIQGEQLDGSDVCSSYGGCRMLLCNCQEAIDPDTGVEMDTDWFTGYCYECMRKIRSRSHSLRLPLIGGGWKYCYCSFKCIKNYIQTIPNCNSYETLLIYNVVRQMQNELKNKKIYDSYDSYDENLIDRSCVVVDDDIGDYICKSQSVPEIIDDMSLDIQNDTANDMGIM